MTKIIGLTGGIGSGKTTIANHFRDLGIPIYFADDAAKIIMQQPKVLAQVKKAFGGSIFESNKLNRQALAAIVFKDPQKLKQLNAIVHPAVYQHFLVWLKQHSSEPIVVKEAAILFESGSYIDCDYIITVTAPLETRINRVMERDHVSKDDVLKRIENQWTDEARISNSDYVIENTNLNDATNQATEILKKLTN